MSNFFNNNDFESTLDNFLEWRSSQTRPFHPSFNPGAASLESTHVLAGHTYFGQLLAHELISSTNIKGILRRPYFDLISLYGKNSINKYGLQSYDNALFDNDGLFLLGIAHNTAKVDTDLYRPSGLQKPLIADPRNDENLFVSQLHLLWLKLHNKILLNKYPKHNNGHSHFNKQQKILGSKKIVNKIFQILVLEEFLKKIINPLILEKFIELLGNNNERLFLLNNKNLTKAPNVISHAVFRFGHSMVRQRYRSNQKFGTAESKDLSFFFKHVELNRNRYAIDNRNIVDWNIFFDPQHVGVQKAMKLDHYFAIDMRKAPLGPSIVNILEHNLRAGYFHHLPTPFEIVRQLQAKHNNYLQAISLEWYTEQIVKQVLNAIPKPLGDMAAKSLWLYLLVESNQANRSFAHEPLKIQAGEFLGPLGSILMMEFILNAIRYSGVSIFPGFLERNNNELIEDFPCFLKEKFQQERTLTMLNLVEYIKTNS